MQTDCTCRIILIDIQGNQKLQWFSETAAMATETKNDQY